MDNLKALKETSFKRISKITDELNSLNDVFGSLEVEEAVHILRKVMRDFMIDLDYLNSKSEEELEILKEEFAKEVTKDWSIKEIADYWCNKLF